MSRSARIFAFAALSSAVLGAGGSQEVRTAAGTGRLGVPVFSEKGELLLAAPDDSGAIGLRPAAPGEAREIRMPAADRDEASLGISGRTAPNGDIGAVWARADGTLFEIAFARFHDGRMVEREILRTDRSPLFSPDLAFGADSRPWAAWIAQTGGRDEVVVQDIDRNRSWVVNESGPTSALCPKLLAGGAAEAWVFWTGNAGERDRVFFSALRGESWSAPRAVDPESAHPQTSPSACLDASGRPVVAWSEYDGQDYEILSADWAGTAWAPAEHVTENGDADLHPDIASVPGGGVVAVWSRSSGDGHALAAALRSGSVWNADIPIGGPRSEPVRPNGIAVSGGRIAIAWTSGAEWRSEIIGLGDLAAGSGSRRVAADDGAPPPFDPLRDENQYTSFGDSITYAEEHGYQPALETKLAAKFGAARIWNEGLGGETTAEGLVRIDKAISGHASRYLLLMEGTNDVIFLDISMDTAAYNLEEMARRGLRAGMLPLLATIIPRSDWRWTTPPFQSRIAELNARIRLLTASLGLPLVDQYVAFLSAPEAGGGWKGLLLDDGVHPNPKGFLVMAEAWYGGIVVLPFPPVNVRATRALDRLLFRRRPGNVVVWRNSSKLDPAAVMTYRIYRKASSDAAFPLQYLAAVSFQPSILEFRYFDAEIDAKKAYQYVITALRADGVEGPCSDIARDDIF